MKEKLRIIIEKLNNTILQPQLIYLYFNAYPLKSVFFGARIIQITKKQEKDFKLMCEKRSVLN